MDQKPAFSLIGFLEWQKNIDKLWTNMKIAIISDTHGKWNKLKIPECDILISCGDYSFRGEPHMIRDFHA